MTSLARMSTVIACVALASACGSDDRPDPKEGDAGGPSAGSGGSRASGGAGAATRGGAGGAGGSISSGGMAGRGGAGAAGSGGKSAAGSGGKSAAGGGVGGTSGKAGGGGGGGAGGEGDRGGRGGSGGGAGSGAAGGVGGGSANGDHGFNFRNPEAKQVDWLCTFGQSEPPGYVYVRLDQTGTMQAGIATIPVYTAALAQVSVAGTVSVLDGAVYDHGGGHNNDSLTIDYQGKSYSYYHSSFGFGFRKCQPMDCMDVYELGSTTLETEGCGPDRALPEVCVPIEAGGTHAPLEDTFQKCPGDAS